MTTLTAPTRTRTAEATRRHQLIMIESMIRNGYSEREITDAVNESKPVDHDGGMLTAFVGWAQRRRRRAS